MIGKVIFSDCGKILPTIISETIDLIYLDPPYFLKKTIKNQNHEFSDNWKSMDEYSQFMKERLIEMHRSLKSTGSIYLHCDYHAVFELKLIMDDIFGQKNFRNNIIWTYRSGGGSPNHNYSKKYDNILFYTKSDNNTFNIHRIPYSCVTTGKRAHLFHPDGKMLGDSWTIPRLSTRDHERTGYPTQKPLELLERIINVSSNPGDLILDPFCGSGTTLEAAKKLGRNFIGIDVNLNAVEICNKRLRGGLDAWI